MKKPGRDAPLSGRPLPDLLRRLNHPVYETCYGAACELVARQQASPDHYLVPELCGRLPRLSRPGQVAVLGALRTLGDARCVPAVARLASRSSGSVCAEAVLTLRCFENDSAVDALISLLDSPHPDRVEEAAHALGQLRERRAVLALGAALYRRRVDLHPLERWERCRAAVADALGEIGDPAAVPVLAAALGPPDSPHRVPFVTALARCGYVTPRTLRYLLILENPATTRRWLAGSLEGVLPSLVALLADDSWIRDAAGDHLLALFPDSFDAVVEGARCGELSVRRVAAALLGRMRDSRAMSVLVESCSSGEPSLQLPALAALEALGSVEAVPALCGLWPDLGARVRPRAAVTLVSLGYLEPELAPALVEALSDHEAATAVRAAAALARLAGDGCMPAFWTAVPRLKRLLGWGSGVDDQGRWWVKCALEAVEQAIEQTGSLPVPAAAGVSNEALPLPAAGATEAGP